MPRHPFGSQACRADAVVIDGRSDREHLLAPQIHPQVDKVHSRHVGVLSSRMFHVKQCQWFASVSLPRLVFSMCPRSQVGRRVICVGTWTRMWRSGGHAEGRPVWIPGPARPLVNRGLDDGADA